MGNSITYCIDGVDFRNYGVYVSASKGLVGRPKIKSVESVSWDDYHGLEVDLSNQYYQAREIDLSCIMVAQNKGEFLVRMASFCSLFDSRGLQRLSVDVLQGKPLIYMVYCTEEIAVDKEWSQADMMGVFSLKLIEPTPVKRVLRHVRSSQETRTCLINISTLKQVNIFWGDGSVDSDVWGENVSVSHNYENDGEYYPVITGNIDEIKSFSTTSEIIWKKL